MGFPFDIQGPGSSRNVLLHILYNKAIEDGNQTCSPPFLLGLVGRMTYLDLTLNIKLVFSTDNAKTRNFVLFHRSEEVFMTDAIHRVTEKLHKPTKNHNTRTNNGIYRLAKRSF